MDDDYRKYGNSRAAHFDIGDPHKCFVCGGAVPDGAIECPSCGFPQNGDEVSQRRFLGELRVEKKEQRFAAYRVGYAFHLLLFLPLGIFWAAWVRWSVGNVVQAEIRCLLGVTFFLIWFFGRSSPFRALALSLVLYTLYTLPAIISNPIIIFAPNPSFAVPHIALIVGMLNFRYWQELDENLKGKNSG
jgi:hypothetical protein